MTPAKLLTLELFLDGSGALILLALPGFAIRLLGWPQSGSSFWPRLVGALLAGFALATMITLANWPKDGLSSGLGLSGHIAINLTIAFALYSMLFLGPDHPTHRGAIFTGILASGLLLLALIEIAYL